MKEFIEKLVGRLEEKVHSYYKQYMDDIIGYSTYNEHKREITGIIEIVNQLAEEYNNGWIPCSERMPEYSDCYNVTVGVSNEMGYYECVKAFNYVKKQGEEGKWVIPKDLFSTYSVIAWQDTPAPYKEGVTENE